MRSGEQPRCMSVCGGRADPVDQAAGGEPAQPGAAGSSLELLQQRRHRAEVPEAAGLAHVAPIRQQRLHGAHRLRSGPQAHARDAGGHARDCLLQRQTVAGHVLHKLAPAAMANANPRKGLQRGDQLRHCLLRPLSRHDGRVDRQNGGSMIALSLGGPKQLDSISKALHLLCLRGSYLRGFHRDRRVLRPRVTRGWIQCQTGLRRGRALLTSRPTRSLLQGGDKRTWFSKFLFFCLNCLRARAKEALAQDGHLKTATQPEPVVSGTTS